VNDCPVKIRPLGGWKVENILMISYILFS